MDTLSEEASFSRALEENPFVLPPDEEVFKMRDEEKRRKKEERARDTSPKRPASLVH